tara:strand:+ start:33 stop:515 length:483 start_codon:yes stop_codon:yes gene_type:complete
LKNKNYNRNPEGQNQWILRSDEEIQKIIDKYPTWTKKDFRGEGKKNKIRILTRKETERKGLIFKTSVYRKKFKNNKLQCSVCKKLKLLNEFPNDIHGWRNKKRSNCSECDVDRNFIYLDKMNSLEKKNFYKKIYENLTEQQLANKRKIQKKYYYETFKNK